MIKRLFCAAALAVLLPAAQAAEGLNTLASAHAVDVTVDRLESALKDAGFRIFARVNHGAGAKSVDLELAPTELLIFGKPQAGTRLMQAQRTVGIDLPMKYLVWEDETGQVLVGWNDAGWMAERHDIDTGMKVLSNVAGALRKFAAQAAE